MKKKLDREGGPIKNAEGGSPKLIKSNLTYQLQTLTKHLTVDDDNSNNAYWVKISAETWAIIGEFDNFSQIKFLNVTSDQLLDCNVIMHDYST